jgi:nitrite reductase/ring-hydroxylating ferredoxin subunit
VSEVRAAPLHTLGVGEVLPIALGKDDAGRPLEAIVVRDAEHTRAYLNRCRHLPIPLDGGSRSFWSPDRKHLRCGTHGALFRPSDGYCELGPCAGDALVALAVRIDDQGWIWVSLP